jgi:hypothetical protein
MLAVHRTEVAMQASAGTTNILSGVFYDAPNPCMRLHLDIRHPYFPRPFHFTVCNQIISLICNSYSVVV